MRGRPRSGESLQLQNRRPDHLTGDIYPGDFDFTVRGIFDSPRVSDLMYMNKEYIDQSMAENAAGNVGIYYILIDDPQNSTHIASAIDEPIRKRNRADEDGIGTGVHRRIPGLSGQRQSLSRGDLRGGDVHHSLGLGEHHGDVRTRAAARSWRAQDDRLYAGRCAGDHSWAKRALHFSGRRRCSAMRSRCF